MNLLIVSTSTIYGKPYLSYLKEECADFFSNAPKILFIPFARPGGMTHEAYTAKAKEVFTSWGFEMRGAHEFTDAQCLPDKMTNWFYNHAPTINLRN